jgi:hypothetical protein
LPYPVDHLSFTPEDWSHYDEAREAGRSNNKRAVLLLSDKLGDGRFAKIAGGELTAILKAKIVRTMFGNQELEIAATMAKLRLIYAELAGPNPSAVEATLADIATLAWLDWCRCCTDVETLGDASFRKARHYDQRADRSHKRLVRSLKALAGVRKVPLSHIQINLTGLPKLPGAHPPAIDVDAEPTMEVQSDRRDKGAS